MSYRSINQSGCVRLRPYYILIILLILILNGCKSKSDCEKAAAFSATDYDNMSEAREQQAIINLKCKKEIDNMGLDEKTAAQKYCHYTKDCSKEEQQQAEIAELDFEIKQKCPREPNYEATLAKELTTDQRRECYDLEEKFNSLSDQKKMFSYWRMYTMVYGAATTHLSSEYRPTGVRIGAPIEYSFVNLGALGSFQISFAVDNQSKIPIFIDKNDVSLYINGKKAPDSSIKTSFGSRVDVKNGDSTSVFFFLTLPSGYYSYEDLVSKNVKVYFNSGVLGNARLFPTAGPLDANDDISNIPNDPLVIYWPHAKKYTSNDWLMGVSGIDSLKNAKVYDNRSAIDEDMKKAGIL